jgi:signal transduction histidine kinase
MAFSKNAFVKLLKRTETIGIISVLLIIGISYWLFFYLQKDTEDDIRNNLFEQQKQRQLDSTRAISQHISSDLDSVMARLQGLANSIYLQQGELSNNKTRTLMQEIYFELNATHTADRLFILNKNNVSTIALVPKGEKTFIGTSFSYRDYVKQTRTTLMPAFSNGFEGRDGKYRIALTYPIVNRETGEYIGLVGAVIPTIQFFNHYGNIHNIKAQYLAVLDRQSNHLIHPLKQFVGIPFFGNYTQRFTGHNVILNNLIRRVMSGQPDLAVYDFINGQRLTTGYPIFMQGKPMYSVFVITPTYTIYSQINDVLFSERLEMFSLLAGVTAAVAVLILFLLQWSNTLERRVKTRTNELDESNQRLEELNEQLKINEKLQKEFVNIAAHELRTPIQPILGLTEILKSTTRDTKDHELVDVVYRNAKRLQHLTEDILDVNRIESQSLQLNKERFNLTEMITDAIADSKNQIAQENKNNNLKLEFVDTKDKESQEDIFVIADKGRISRVISNLLSNAVKFTKEGIITVSIQKKDNEVLVSIKDTGAGIDAEILPRLFTKFTTKSVTGGTGLGLFISKSIVDVHGGKIWGENNLDGKGATFTFSLHFA